MSAPSAIWKRVCWHDTCIELAGDAICVWRKVVDMAIEDVLKFVEIVRYQVPDAKNRRISLSLVLMSENIVLFFFFSFDLL